MTKVKLGDLFNEAIKKYPTEKQKKPREYYRTKGTNSMGIANIGIVDCRSCTQGHTYQFRKSVQGEVISFRHVDILKLKDRVLSEGYNWRVFDEDLARQTAENAGVSYEDLVG